MDIILKRLEIEKLICDLFETGIIADSKRNRLLLNLITICIMFIINFIKTEQIADEDL